MKTRKTDSLFLGLLAALLTAAYFSPAPESPAPALHKGIETVATTQDTLLVRSAADIASQYLRSGASTILPRTVATTTTSLPDFAAIQDVRTKKNEFFRFMLPLIRESNERIRAERHFLLSMRDDLRSGIALDSAVLSRFGELSRYYRVKPGSGQLQQVDKLLLRVDVVPESLVLAQSANESGWGTSRFARQANNLFGVWCFTRGCGLTPLSRDKGLTHEVARYDTVQDSVDAYVRTINTNAAYQHLRQIRAESRAGNEIVSGLALAEGLIKYSSRGLDYVREIQQMIRVNNLHEYNYS